MSIYRVTGRQRYEGYRPGDIFIGELPPDKEARAVARGSIEVVEAGPVSLDATRVTFPRGWVNESQSSGVGR